ncbi:hypothetical protein [Abyssalbus ytuae]|uniref:Uncharacterized protein n=1 Tax=Abyssalbus ytuae TaxID=2926907 RepID=A0A9E7A2L9_9FLAO|nr:hypothetical protein [Abyssalbus ytuae]UOB18651.1 hypothetical protein MQE35_05015 [Abyssalbus ytuae]
MRNTILLLLLLSKIYCYSQNPEIKPYVDYLKKTENKSAKDYILQQFKTHDIVILCERHHREFSQYELIKEILSDEYFKKNVKNIFTEIGVINLQPEITEFLKTNGLDSLYVENKLNDFQQNASFYFVWEQYNFHFFLKTIYDINNNSENQISLYPSDSEFDWKKVKTAEDYKREYEIEIEPRDSIIAFNIINRYKKIKSEKNKKALVILNYRHAFKIHTIRSNGELQQNTGKYLSDYFGNRLVSILLNCPIFFKKDKKWEYKLIQDGKWDAAFKKLDIDNMGFDFKNSVFGNDKFDLWNEIEDIKYKDVFDGFVFYKTIENHDLIEYYKGLISKDFENEFFRRLKIQLEYFENTSFLEKIEDKTFREGVVKEWNTKKNIKYGNLKYLIESRDKYFIK